MVQLERFKVIYKKPTPEFAEILIWQFTEFGV